MATGLPILVRGSDEIIEVELLDNGDNPINPNDCTDIIVSVYQLKEDVLQLWKLSLGEVSIYDAANGLVHVKLDRLNTTNIPIKRLFVEVALYFSDADFEGGVQIQKQSDIPLADLINSVLA